MRVFALVELVGACASPRGERPFGGTDGAATTMAPGTTTITSATSDAGPTSAASDATTSSGGDETEDLVFDIGVVDAPGSDCEGADVECHCNAVDLLFVVDNSGSMQIYSDQITAAFPTFVEEMFTALPPNTDLHVGLTRATGFYDPGDSGGWYFGHCEAALTDGAWVPPDVGDNMTNGQQGRLFEHEGLRFFGVNTNDDPTPLETWFAGALEGAIEIDAHSNTETVCAAAAYPFHAANAAHNAGFMRQNAVLVLFLISDSPDLSPTELATQDFVDIVRDAKAACGGDACIVTSGAIQGDCYGQPDNTNTRLYDFMNAFGKPPASWISLDGDTIDFENVLGTALAEVVATTCEQIPPEG